MSGGEATPETAAAAAPTGTTVPLDSYPEDDLRTEAQLTYESASITQLAVRYDKRRSGKTGQDDDDAANEENSKPQKPSGGPA